MPRKKPDDLTDYARAGYKSEHCPHLWSSPAWTAHRLGEYLRESGRTEPRDVRMSRGQQIRANDMLFKYALSVNQIITFERIQ